VKIVRIKSDVPDVKGKITGRWKSTETVVDVTTTTRDILTPINGLEFEKG